MSAIAHTSTKPDTQDSDKILHERLAAARARAFGEYGADFISAATGYVTGQTWSAIQAITAATFLELDGNLTNGYALSLPAGAIVYGRFTLIEIFTGSLIAYRAL